MNIKFSSNGWEDYLHWQNADKTILKRINRLIEEIKRNPFEGIGKSEMLRESLAGFWSRRIDETNRLVYEVSENDIAIISCRYHY